jgi:hypothetical protein
MHRMRSKEVGYAQVATVARPTHERCTWHLAHLSNCRRRITSAVGHVPCHSHRQNEREHEPKTNVKSECRVEAAVPVAQYEDAINQSR